MFIPSSKWTTHVLIDGWQQVRSEVGPVTMLFNNAGIVTGRKFLDTPDEMNIKTMEVCGAENGYSGDAICIGWAASDMKLPAGEYHISLLDGQGVSAVYDGNQPWLRWYANVAHAGPHCAAVCHIWLTVVQ